jgi:hypothetical protein
MEGKGNANKIFVRNSESSKLLERPWFSRQLNIKINLTGIASDNVDFIYFWAGFCDSIMHIRVKQESTVSWLAE